MNILIVNYAIPEEDASGLGTRWWHKSGSRWPATILNRGNSGSEYFPWPFLLGYLAAMLELDGHRITLLDGCLHKMSLDEMEKAVRSASPDLIVFETSEQTEKGDAALVARFGTVSPCVLVGPNVAEDRQDLLAWPGCYALVPGEYLSSVVRFLRAPFPGIAQREEVVGQAAMDALPFAWRSASDFLRYSARFKTTPAGPQGQFVSMWGCQYRCKFCIWVNAYWSKSSQMTKQFSLDRLDLELDDLIKRFPNITSLYDDADNHRYRRDDAFKFAEMMGRKRLPWAILTRADTYLKNGEIDREVWKAYRQCGCYAIKLGIEGSQDVMDATGKHLSEDIVRDFVTFVQDIGMSVYCSFMLGVPGVSVSADQGTLHLIDELASYRPEMFEYLVSHCDVTRATPFYHENPREDYPHDGQIQAERLTTLKILPPVLGGVRANNLR